jgi:uncharacterized protein YkwD
MRYGRCLIALLLAFGFLVPRAADAQLFGSKTERFRFEDDTLGIGRLNLIPIDTPRSAEDTSPRRARFLLRVVDDLAGAGFYQQLTPGGTHLVAFALQGPNGATLFFQGTLTPTGSGQEAKGTWLAIADPTVRHDWTAVSAAPEDPISLREEMLDQINQYRRDSGLQPLAEVRALTTAAQRHADDMAANDFVNSTGSNGSTFNQRIRAAGYRGRIITEYVSAGPPSPEATLARIAHNRTANALILSTTVRECGIGVAGKAGSDRFYWCVDLGAP